MKKLVSKILTIEDVNKPRLIEGEYAYRMLMNAVVESQFFN